MAGAMRKMAVYLGLVEDDGYDGRGFDPDDEFEPELDPEPDRGRRQQTQVPPNRTRNGTNRYGSPSLPRSVSPHRRPPKADDPPESPPWRPSHPTVRTWRRTHR